MGRSDGVHQSGRYPGAFRRSLRHAVLQQIAHAEEWRHGERQHRKSFDEPPGLLLDEFDGHLASIFAHNHAANRILEVSDDNVEAVRHIAQRGRQQRTRLRYIYHDSATGCDRSSCRVLVQKADHGLAPVSLARPPIMIVCDFRQVMFVHLQYPTHDGA